MRYQKVGEVLKVGLTLSGHSNVRRAAVGLFVAYGGAEQVYPCSIAHHMQLRRSWRFDSMHMTHRRALLSPDISSFSAAICSVP